MIESESPAPHSKYPKVVLNIFFVFKFKMLNAGQESFYFIHKSYSTVLPHLLISVCSSYPPQSLLLCVCVFCTIYKKYSSPYTHSVVNAFLHRIKWEDSSEMN